MATTRLLMRHLREIFRQKYELKRYHRQIARSVGVSSGGVAGATSRAKAVGLDWAQIQTLGDEALGGRLPWLQRPGVPGARRRAQWEPGTSALAR